MEENRGLDMEERRGGRREFIWEKRREKEEEKGRYGDKNAWLHSIRDEHAEESMWQQNEA